MVFSFEIDLKFDNVFVMNDKGAKRQGIWMDRNYRKNELLMQHKKHVRLDLIIQSHDQTPPSPQLNYIEEFTIYSTETNQYFAWKIKAQHIANKIRTRNRKVINLEKLCQKSNEIERTFPELLIYLNKYVLENTLT